MYSDLGDVVNYGVPNDYSVPGAFQQSALERQATDLAELWENAERVFSPGLALLHVHGILLGFEYELDRVKVLQNHLAFIESLFAIMQQRITVVHHHQPTRQIRRGIERDTGQVPDVRVVTLRRPSSPPLTTATGRGSWTGPTAGWSLATGVGSGPRSSTRTGWSG